jgi:hypothetical protein
VRQWTLRAVYKFGYMLETPRIRQYSVIVTPSIYGDDMVSENLRGAVNQQERLDAYIAGFVDGEGSFSVAIQRNRTCRMGWQLLPEFHVSQNPERRAVLDLIQQRLGCGRIRENHRGSTDTSLVLVVRKRIDLTGRVIPFFETQPLISSKQDDFVRFAHVVWAMDRGVHFTASGFDELRTVALSMNGGGRYRRVHRITESSETICRTSTERR